MQGSRVKGIGSKDNNTKQQFKVYKYILNI